MSSLEHESGSVDLDLTWNRINLALAKSQRLVATWLPPAAPSLDIKATTADPIKPFTTPDKALDDEPFQTTSEKTGFGYTPPSDPAGTSSHLPTLNPTDRLRGLLLPGTKKGKGGRGSSARGTDIVGIVGVMTPVASMPKLSTLRSHDPRLGKGDGSSQKNVNEDGDDDDDDDEEFGSRSRLGRPKSGALPEKWKRNLEPETVEHELDSIKGNSNDNGGELQDLKVGPDRSGSNIIKSPKTSAASTKLRQPAPHSNTALGLPQKKKAARSYLDEILAERETKRKKKAEKKRDKATAKDVDIELTIDKAKAEVNPT